jgi:exopolyphosphatase/guanosine-5'-triphosphate,3'-diphosphate pyrophosphatase
MPHAASPSSKPAEGRRHAPERAQASADGYVAVIDIGSNAVRLVVYDGLNRAPFKIHNERTQCHLGRHLAATGRLNPEGVTLALDSIGRYAGLIKAMNIREVRAVATAAMRDAADGRDFIAKIKNDFGLDIRIIEGEEEARLAALGVMMNGLGARGVVGDYGGGSLELIVLENDVVRHKASLPLGAHRLHALKTQEERAAAIDKHLSSVPFLKDFTRRDFYAMGGAWRSMARAHMRMTRHPLFVLDHYAVEGGKAADFARLIAGQSPAALEKTVGAMEQRLHDMGVAALTMEKLFAVLKPSRLIFSGTGLREGMLYDSLPPEVQKRDPLLASCEKVALQASRFTDLAGFDALVAWMLPLFTGVSEKALRLLKASCLLSDISWFEHEDYQAAHAFERIFVMPFYGIDHPSRAFLALTQYARYGGRDEKTRAVAGRLIDEGMVTAALGAGLAQRMGYLLTGGALRLLADSALSVSARRVTLKLKPRARLLNADSVSRALDDLAKAMGKEAHLEAGE